MVSLREKRSRLQDRIDQFSQSAAGAWPINSDNVPSYVHDFLEADNLLSDESEDEDDNFNKRAKWQLEWAPELAVLPLPSSFGREICTNMGYGSLIAKELKFRMGQANDALQGIRVALSRKAILFRGLCAATSKTKRNRSWDQIKSTAGSARHHVRIYVHARKAMIRLGASPQDLQKYQPLTKEQLKITAARIDPSLRGTRNHHLAWFWSANVEGDCQSVEGMEECEFNCVDQGYKYVSF